jgi:hypothetical protein
VLRRTFSATLEQFAPRKTGIFPMWSALMRLLPGKSCSWRHPGLKHTWIGAIFKKFFMKTILKSKINLIRKTVRLSEKRENNYVVYRVKTKILVLVFLQKFIFGFAKISSQKLTKIAEIFAKMQNLVADVCASKFSTANDRPAGLVVRAQFCGA